MSKHVIVVGGGLSGLTTAHTVLEQGGRVLLLDKSAYLGGNSTKATSGINGALTQTQIAHGIKDDSREIFYDDALKSAAEGARAPLVKVLTYGSAPGVEWLQEKFGIDLSKVAMMGGHSMPRCHRGKERFPGAAITMQLMEAFDKICEDEPHRAQLKCKARVCKLLQDAAGAVIGCEYEDKDGVTHAEYGPVALCSGGFGADFSDTSLLAEVEPEWNQLKAFGDVPTAAGRLRTLPTTNGAHCTGDGVKMTRVIGAGSVDMEAVQVHPTGLINPDDPKCKVRFLAAEALRGCGGILLDQKGERFVNELGKRDYVTGRMWNNGVANGVKPGDEAFPLILNSAASKEIDWHCKHYSSRGLMKQYANGHELAIGLGVPAATIEREFAKYNQAAAAGTDEFGKVFFKNAPFEMSDSFHVGLIGPTVHYTMGGVEANEHSEVLMAKTKAVIPGLFAAGEVMGGVHGKNRLGGNSLLDCVVYGRVAGRTAAKYLLESHLKNPGVAALAGNGVAVPMSVGGTMGATTLTLTQGGATTTITVPAGQKLNLSFEGLHVAPGGAKGSIDICSALAACLVPPSDLKRS